MKSVWAFFCYCGVNGTQASQLDDMELETAIEDIKKQLQELQDDLARHQAVQQQRLEMLKKQEESLQAATFFIKKSVLPHVRQLSDKECLVYLPLLVEMHLTADAVWLVSRDTLIGLVVPVIPNTLHAALIVDAMFAAAVDM